MRGLTPAIILILVLLIGGTATASHFISAATPAQASASASAGPIPDEAIRIRIIANSDSNIDQATKLAVRDRVAQEIVSWGQMPATIDEARALIKSHLDDVQEASDEVLQARGAGYGAKVELAKVPFPAKTFEGYDYPAGEYEALRVTLGEGAGANWWCVLFPALCLGGATSKDDDAGKSSPSATDAQQVQTEQGADGEKSENAAAAEVADKSVVSKSKAHVVKTNARAEVVQAADQRSDPTAAARQGEDAEKPKAEFFIIVLIKKLFAWLASLFA